jgi:hypothetical protein
MVFDDEVVALRCGSVGASSGGPLAPKLHPTVAARLGESSGMSFCRERALA